jgi:protein ImuB
MFAVVHAPAFGLQAVVRHEPGMAARPLALVDPALANPRVVSLNAVARANGVEEGLTAPQAMARCAGVVVRHRSVAAEDASRDALLQGAHAFSPGIEWTADGCVTLDMRGLSDPGPEPSGEALTGWGRRLALAMQGLGFAVRVGIAPTPGVARHAASAEGAAVDPVVVITPGEAAGFVASLPVATLDPSPHAAHRLEQWGVRSVGDLLRLGQADLAERLGLEAFALWAAASHSTVRPLRHERLPEAFAEEAPLDPPVETLEPVLFLLRRFADSLSQRLEGAGRAAGELCLRLRLESGDALDQRLRLPQPTHRAEVLFRMLATHLEGLRTPAAVSGLRLHAEPARPHQHQFGLFDCALRDPHQFQETLARLAALVGPERVGSPVRIDGHRPDQFRVVPPDFESAVSNVGRRTPELLRPVPVRRLRPAQPATVEYQPMRRAGASPSDTAAGPRPGGSHVARAARPGAVLSPASLAALLDPLFRPPPAPVVPAAPAPPAAAAESKAEAPSGVVVPFPTAPMPAERPVDVPGRPWSVRCAWVEGRVQAAAGPIHASGGWWEAGRAWQRVEWDVMVQGRHGLRLAWDGTAWQVEAVMD